MAKKKPSKQFTQKVEHIVKSNIFTSIALVSILLNILFLVGIFVLSSPNTYDRELYEGIQSRYCKNINSLINDANNSGNDEEVITKWKVTCISEEFLPFYKEAIEKFNASTEE